MTGTQNPRNTANATNATGLALGLGLGAAIGTGIGLLTDQVATWLALGTSLGLVFGLSADASARRGASDPRVKIVDGATYTLVARDHPATGQRTHCWLGDDGRELELSDEEATSLRVD